MVYDPYAGDPVLSEGGTGHDSALPVDPYTGQRSSLEDRLTPKPKILDTSFHQLPTKETGGMPWDNWQPPSFTGMADRVGTEMKQTFQGTQGPFPPGAIDWANTRQGWLGPYVLSPAMQAANYLTKGAAAAGAGVTANAAEILGAGDPKLVRDAHAALTIAPALAAAVPPGVAYRPSGPQVPGDPNFVGPIPKEAVTISTPADAKKLSSGLYKAADASDFKLNSQFSQDWANHLDSYRTQEPAGAAVREQEHPTDALINDLQKVRNAPMENITSIQQVDQRIGRAMKAADSKYGPGNEYSREMQQILRDFRDRYENAGPTDYTGSPQGVQDFKNARQAYAAYSRMQDVQRIIDNSDLHDNPATAIRTQIRTFLRNESNTKGWTDAEKDSLRRAADNGFVREWLRTEGSRLLGIGAAVAGGAPAAVVAVPAQVGFSYAMRNALENIRLRDLQRTQQLMGQRVPQPGTIPQQPGPVPVPGLLSSGLRYAPLTNLLESERQGG